MNGWWNELGGVCFALLNLTRPHWPYIFTCIHCKYILVRSSFKNHWVLRFSQTSSCLKAMIKFISSQRKQWGEMRRNTALEFGFEEASMKRWKEPDCLIKKKKASSSVNLWINTFFRSRGDLQSNLFEKLELLEEPLRNLLNVFWYSIL